MKRKTRSRPLHAVTCVVISIVVHIISWILMYKLRDTITLSVRVSDGIIILALALWVGFIIPYFKNWLARRQPLSTRDTVFIFAWIIFGHVMYHFIAFIWYFDYFEHNLFVIQSSLLFLLPAFQELLTLLRDNKFISLSVGSIIIGAMTLSRLSWIYGEVFWSTLYIILSQGTVVGLTVSKLLAPLNPRKSKNNFG